MLLDGIPPSPGSSRTAVTGESRARIGSLDALRTIMCLGIVLYHFIPYFFGDGDPLYEGSRVFACFTDMFFVFAGFFMAQASTRDWTASAHRHFLVSRLARLYPLHILTFGFYLLIALCSAMGLFTPENASRYDLSAVVPHLTLTHGWGLGPSIAFNYPSWAISSIFGCYLLLPCFG